MAMRKVGNVKYSVHNGEYGGRYVICPVQSKTGEYVTSADLKAILRKEFRGIPSKNITFSVDTHNLLFGNDWILTDKKDKK